MTDRPTIPGGATIAVVLKGYPRLSETFIAQELRGLERRGFTLRFISLRHPTDAAGIRSTMKSRRLSVICQSICTKSRYASCEALRRA